MCQRGAALRPGLSVKDTACALLLPGPRLAGRPGQQQQARSEGRERAEPAASSPSAQPHAVGLTDSSHSSIRIFLVVFVEICFGRSR